METQDIYGTRIRLTRDGLTYGEEFVPFAEMGGQATGVPRLLEPWH